MLVDYVRLYERDASPPPVVFRNGSFEAQGGSLAGWSTFGNELSNVQTHHEATALDGDETLKIFGQFNGFQNFSGVEQGISVSPGDSVSASASALVRSADDLVGGNTIIMTLNYYNDFGGEFGSSSYLSSTSVAIADTNTSNDVWLPVNLTDTVPAGAVEARLSFVFVQPEFDGGAIHIDNVHFTNLDLEFDADADSDGDVDSRDFLSWQQGLGQNDGTSVAAGDFNFDGVVDASDLAVWNASFAGFSEVSAITVPEPTSQVLLAFVLFAFLRTR